MEIYKLAFALLIFYIPVAQSWGIDGHLIICRIAQVLTLIICLLLLCFVNSNRVSSTDADSPLLQPRLSKAAEDAVSKLLPAYAGNDLGSMCSWADRVKFRYHWSSPLHYLNTPDNLCTYQYNSEHIISLFCIIKKIISFSRLSQYLLEA